MWQTWAGGGLGYICYYSCAGSGGGVQGRDIVRELHPQCFHFIIKELNFLFTLNLYCSFNSVFYIFDFFIIYIFVKFLSNSPPDVASCIFFINLFLIVFLQV
jgi:hypothetical protein